MALLREDGYRLERLGDEGTAAMAAERPKRDRRPGAETAARTPTPLRSGER